MFIPRDTLKIRYSVRHTKRSLKNAMETITNFKDSKYSILFFNRFLMDMSHTRVPGVVTSGTFYHRAAEELTSAITLVFAFALQLWHQNLKPLVLLNSIADVRGYQERSSTYSWCAVG